LPNCRPSPNGGIRRSNSKGLRLPRKATMQHLQLLGQCTAALLENAVRKWLRLPEKAIAKGMDISAVPFHRVHVFLVIAVDNFFHAEHGKCSGFCCNLTLGNNLSHLSWGCCDIGQQHFLEPELLRGSPILHFLPNWAHHSTCSGTSSLVTHTNLAASTKNASHSWVSGTARGAPSLCP